MKTKTFRLLNIAVISMLGLTTIQAAPLLGANRELCSPQNANMAQQATFTSKCEWSKLQPGMDSNAQITLNGKKTVHAECEFSGPDSIAMVIGHKHAEFDGLFLPGNKFSFDIKYRETDDVNDDNQNIEFYLKAKKPAESDVLTCQFSVMQ